MTPPRCQRCDARMAEGFVVDHGDSGMASVPRWQPGTPVKKWFGLKTSKPEQREVVTWRCERCGRLESFAP